MLLFALLLQQAAADSFTAVAQAGACVNAVGCAGFYRAIAISTSPPNATFEPVSTVFGISAASVGAQADTNGVTTNANVDLAGFKFITPGDVSVANPQLSFYYGYLGASGEWDASTKAGNVSGAFLEILSTVAGILVYHDRDSTPGLQWDLTNNANEVFNCLLPGTFDCVELNAFIKVGLDLIFNPIAKNETNCSTVATGYGPNCKIVELTSTASLNGTTGVVLTVRARAVTQPIIINGILHTPLKLKWDIVVSPPWSAWTGKLQSTTNPSVAILFFHGGKAGVGVASTVAGGAGQLAFNVAGGKAAYFGYVGWANTDTGGNTTIYTQTITGAQILAYNPTGVATLAITKLLQAQAVVVAAFGWSYQITIHSFIAVSPNTINWDPEVGMTTSSTTNDSALLLPSAFLALLALFW